VEVGSTQMTEKATKSLGSAQMAKEGLKKQNQSG
jgi:hypothetical protein